jgi:hypothetical protein
MLGRLEIKKKLLTFCFFLAATLVSFANANTILTDDEIDAKLSSLNPLPKVHYYWPNESVSDKRLYQLVRITHSASLIGAWSTAENVDRQLYACARINKTNPEIEARLSVLFSPWHDKFDKKLGPTDRGDSYFAELAFFDERAKLIKQWIAAANQKYGTDIKVGAVLLDSERFNRMDGNSEAANRWNDGMREDLDAIHIRATKYFGGARIEWFVRGIGPADSVDGWANSTYWTGKEIKAPMSCALYRVPEIEGTRETFRRTCKLADKLEIEDVTPWVALASGWRRHPTKLQYWSTDWDYDIIYSYLIGAELNIKWYGNRPERFAPYNRAKVVVFYPPPFDKRTPNYAKHFIAYVRGATSVTYLEDLGLEP